MPWTDSDIVGNEVQEGQGVDYEAGHTSTLGSVCLHPPLSGDNG
jgi:hypothetical protein